MKRARAIRWIPAFAVTSILASCSPVDEVLRPEGDAVEVAMVGKRVIEGELIAVTDSELIVLAVPDRSKIDSVWTPGAAPARSNVQYIQHLPLDRVHQVSVKGYVNRNWVGSVVAFELIPTILLVGAAASVEAESGAVLAFGGGLTVLTYFILEASTPSVPKFQEPFVPSVRESVRRHSRFAQNLTEEQLAHFEKQFQSGSPTLPKQR
jgi:hypothetical protein